ncbi:hypothetical protein JQC92_02390 [Shewanella sp. 202IG2-18]|uniref:hypothetical protein n=1 Tax=Parashewanella hymeniacidonis TaxID=2807618 RepID=UPI0019617CB7|nr:hypothetical protein [Parashewanella hymeniacidonis]MBM7070890.1 hypothetical protein [Parashewanella hymeniacidonis]
MKVSDYIGKLFKGGSELRNTAHSAQSNCANDENAQASGQGGEVLPTFKTRSERFVDVLTWQFGDILFRPELMKPKDIDLLIAEIKYKYCDYPECEKEEEAVRDAYIALLERMKADYVEVAT